MTVPIEDLDRVRQDHGPDDALTRDDIREELDSAGFEGNSLEAFADGIAGREDVAVSRQALNDAQRQAISRLGDGGRAGGQLIRSTDTNPPTTIGKPQNVEYEVVRTGNTEGKLVARNKRTGTSGGVGTVELAPPPEGA